MPFQDQRAIKEQGIKSGGEGVFLDVLPRGITCEGEERNFAPPRKGEEEEQNSPAPGKKNFS